MRVWKKNLLRSLIFSACFLASISLFARHSTEHTRINNFNDTLPENVLLWRISGNGLKDTSYLFGTLHIYCKNDIVYSDAFKEKIRRAKAIYFESYTSKSYKDLYMKDTTIKELVSGRYFRNIKK